MAAVCPGSQSQLPHCSPRPYAQGLFCPHGPLGRVATVVNASDPDCLLVASLGSGCQSPKEEIPAQDTPGTRLCLRRKDSVDIKSCCFVCSPGNTGG